MTTVPKYTPGGPVCIFDDSTECECAQCLDDEYRWEEWQGWHLNDVLDTYESEWLQEQEAIAHDEELTARRRDDEGER